MLCSEQSEGREEGKEPERKRLKQGPPLTVIRNHAFLRDIFPKVFNKRGSCFYLLFLRVRQNHASGKDLICALWSLPFFLHIWGLLLAICTLSAKLRTREVDHRVFHSMTHSVPTQNLGPGPVLLSPAGNSRGGIGRSGSLLCSSLILLFNEHGKSNILQAPRLMVEVQRRLRHNI